MEAPAFMRGKGPLERSDKEISLNRRFSAGGAHGMPHNLLCRRSRSSANPVNGLFLQPVEPGAMCLPSRAGRAARE